MEGLELKQPLHWGVAGPPLPEERGKSYPQLGDPTAQSAQAQGLSTATPESCLSSWLSKPSSQIMQRPTVYLRSLIKLPPMLSDRGSNHDILLPRQVGELEESEPGYFPRSWVNAALSTSRRTVFRTPGQVPAHPPPNPLYKRQKTHGAPSLRDLSSGQKVGQTEP